MTTTGTASQDTRKYGRTHGNTWALAATAITVIASLLTAATLALHPAPASAAVTWPAQTCAALTAYQAHPAAARLTTLVTDAAHLPKSYLKSDMLQVAADASSPSKNAWKYLTVSEQYAAQDCYGGA